MLDSRRIAHEQDQALSTGSAGRAKHRKIDSCSLQRGILRPRLGAVAVTLKGTEQFERTLGAELI